ncbi:MAG: hypothetical protein AAF362_10810 [Pseudomonadota bacterium]
MATDKTQPLENAKNTQRGTGRNFRNFIWQGALSNQAWVLSSPSIVMPFIAVSLQLPIFLAGSLVALRHTAGTVIDVLALGWLSKTPNRKRGIMIADVGIGLCYVAFVVALFSDNKVAIGIAFTGLLLLIGAIHEVKSLLITPFFTENLNSDQRVRVQFLQILAGGLCAIGIVLLIHWLLIDDASLTRHALVVTTGAVCFVLSGLALMTIRDVGSNPDHDRPDTNNDDQATPRFFKAARELSGATWFRNYMTIRLLLVMMGLSVPIFALVTAQAHHDTRHGLTALLVSSAASLTISAPLWRVVNGYSYRLTLIVGALMVFAAGLLLVLIDATGTKQPVYLHATAVFVASAAASGMTSARVLYFMDLAPKDQLFAAQSVVKTIARFAIIGCVALLAGIAHTQDSIWSVIIIMVCALAATAMSIILVPATRSKET